MYDLEQTQTIFYLEWPFFAINLVRSVQSGLDSTHYIPVIKGGLYRIRVFDATPAVMLSPAVAMAITSQRDASYR